MTSRTDSMSAISLPPELSTIAPEITAPTAQIANPAPAVYKRLDIPEVNMLQLDELEAMRLVAEKVDTAKEFIPFLYSYRSIQKALSRSEVIKSMLNSNTVQESTRYFDLFRELFLPRVYKLLEIMEFCNGAAKFIANILMSKTYEPSTVLLGKMMELFDVLFNIDAIKNIKGGISIDVSTFKRDKALKQPMYDELNAKIITLQPFMATPYVVLNQIRSLLGLDSDTNKSESLSFCTKLLEHSTKMLKQNLIRTSAVAQSITTIVSVLLIHGSKSNLSMNIFNTHEAKEAIQVLADYPIGLLYGENTFIVGDLFRRMQGYTPIKGISIPTDSNELRPQEHKFLVKNRMKEFRVLYRENLGIASKMAREDKVTIEGLTSLLACLTKMCLSVQLQSKFKFTCLAQDIKGTTKYDLAVRYNYSTEDLSSLVELIGYIKTLASTALLAEAAVMEFVYNTIEKSLEEFSSVLTAPLQRAKQASDDLSVSIIDSVKMLLTGGFSATRRQIDVLRAQLEAILNDRSPFREKVTMFTGPHLKSKDISSLTSFLESSSTWPDLMEFACSIRETTNLGSLWFRELFIDMDGVVQFPVRSSLPFVLTEHLLNITDDPALHDSFFFPFELYNDAAAMALNTFDSKHLFKEIEAEVALCIDMITFQFAETFFRLCRKTAAAMELPTDCIGRIVPTPMRYGVIVQQNKLELLGCAVDFNLIATTKLNDRLRQELELITTQFLDFRSASLVEHLIRVSRTTHSLLLENHLKMDDFTAIWERATGSDNPLILESAICSKAFNSIEFHKMRFNCSSRKFTFSKDLVLSPHISEAWAAEYVKIHAHEASHVGPVHYQAIIKMLSPGELSVFIGRCITKLESATIAAIDTYSKAAAIVRLLPSINKDDLFGFYAFCSDAYGSIASDLLNCRIYESFKVMGNIISFLWCLESEMEPSSGDTSIMAPAMQIIKKYLLENSALFFSEPDLDLESTITHRSFSSIWSVIEFLFCSKRTKVPGDNMFDTESSLFEKILTAPIEIHGDGPMIAAHIISTLCGQTNLYKFDSICFRSLELHNIERIDIYNEDLKCFIANAGVSNQSRRFAEIIAAPYELRN